MRACSSRRHGADVRRAQIKMIDPDTDRPLFQTRCIELACEACIADGKGHECVHRLHLVPQWQSAER